MSSTQVAHTSLPFCNTQCCLLLSHELLLSVLSAVPRWPLLLPYLLVFAVLYSLAHGPTGTGKTHSALFTNIDEDQIYLKHACDLKKDWWQGYKGQSRVVIDEFYSGCAHITTFLKLLDKYRKELKVKNSITYSRWKELIITTNLRYPEAIYSGANEDHRRALFRRIFR